DGDGTYTENDLQLADQYFSNGGENLRNLPIATKEKIDVHPVTEGNCGDGKLSHQDLIVLTYMLEDQRKEQQKSNLGNSRQRCNNECREGQESLAPNGYRICGQTDTDTCREWVEHQCPPGYQAHQNKGKILCVNNYVREGQDILE
ncbi:MAG: hypothetical protein Q7R56_03610, partial [Nanoarchaeota archaeon]|nr:hypothetical protein [Nanoarchaeota archaeon]